MYIPGGYSDICIHTYARDIFWVQNFEFQYFLGVFRKNIIFWDVKILWIYFGGHHKIGLYLGVISMHFMVFSEGLGTKWGYFLGR